MTSLTIQIQVLSGIWILFGGLLLASGPEASRQPFTVQDVAGATFTEPLALKSRGPAVMRAEILLDRIKYSPGEISGVFGRNLEQTVIAYRRGRGLPLDPVIDQNIWNMLNADTAPLFVEYQIDKSDIVRKVRPQGYVTTLELLGEKFHISPRLLTALNPDADFEEPGTVLQVPNVLTPPPPVPASLCINGTDLTLQGLDATGHILMSYPISVGTEHDPLPVGSAHIRSIHKNPTYFLDTIHFWDATGPRRKARIDPGPNNPVGLVWLGISKAHYGIHGTPWPGRIGRGRSHGCIRMTNWDAAELAGVVFKDMNVFLKNE